MLESTSLFNALIENATDAVVVVDAKGGIVYESRSSHVAVEDKPASSLDSRLAQVIHPDDVQRVLDQLERVRHRPGETVREEVRYRHRDGSWRLAEGVARNLLDDPRVNGIVINYHDTTEKRRAEGALRDSEAKYRGLFEVSQVAIEVISIETGLLVMANEAAARMWGFVCADDMIGINPLDFLQPQDRGWVIEKMVGALAGLRLTETVELRVRASDGRPVWASGMASRTEYQGKPALLISLLDITERKKAEEALRESEKRYRLLAENLSDVIWVVDLDLRFTFVSPSVERLLGYSAEEAMGMPAELVVTRASFETAMKVMADEENRERSGDSDRERSVTLEAELPRKDGSTVWTENRVSYLRDSTGTVIGFLGVTRDVSDRRRAQEALRASEERFRTIFEESPIGAVVYDAAGVALAANKACKDIFGLSTEADLKSQSLFGGLLLAEEAKPRLRSGRVVAGETQIDLDAARKTGAYSCARSGVIYVRSTITPLSAAVVGSPVGYLALVEDITERKKAEEALRASEERFRGLVETTSDWVWEADPRGVYTYVSPKVRNVLGFDSREMTGKTTFDFMPQREARRVASVFGSFVKKQEPFAFLENVHRHKDGHPVVMETSGVPFFALDGTLIGYRGVARDITERKQVAKELQESIKKLERTMEAIIQTISTTMETRDPYTAGHQRRVTQLASVMASNMSLPSRQIAGIRVAGLLHDIGKISIPTEILTKPGHLSRVEMAMIRAHPGVGYSILKNIEFEWPVAQIILQHHERLDGSGYPAGMRGEEILLEARILAVADVVEAMSSHRPYRPAMGMDKALQEITRGEGTVYDPVVVRACLEAFTKKGFQFED